MRRNRNRYAEVALTYTRPWYMRMWAAFIGTNILVFLVFHILHFTVGSAHPTFIEGDPYHNVATGFHNLVVVIFYLIVMALVGLHLYHGLWSSGRSLGVAQPSPQPLQRSLAMVLALLIWLGFSVIPIAVYAGVVK